ncbi:MAG: MMPL family transporter, partial [Phycisphaerae bacterium]
LERFLNGTGLKMKAAPDPRAATFAGRLANQVLMSLSRASITGHPVTSTQPATTSAPPSTTGTLELAELGAATPLDLGYSYLPDDSDHSRHVLLIAVYHREDFKSLTAISETVEAIRAAVAQAAAAYPEFKVGVTGRPALDADEMRTSDRDTNIAEIIAISVVFVGLVLMLRSVWIALVAEISLAVGIGWTFGWATITVGELNLLSLVFVIALIGIGMDYLIQILTRYRREATRYVRQQAIWARVFRYVSPPILTACLGASGAFLVSALTDFRGAADLGIIAGGGLLLCLLSGYTVLPAILVLWPPKLKAVAAENRYGDKHSQPRTGWWHLTLPVTWVLLCLAGIPFMLKAEFDPNLLHMQAQNLESVQLVRKLQTWYGVVLSDDLDQLRQVRKSLAGAETVASTDSLLVPLDNQNWIAAHPESVPQIDWRQPPLMNVDEALQVAAAAEALGRNLDKLSQKPSPQNSAYRDAAAPLHCLAEVIRNQLAPKPEPNSAPQAATLAALNRWQQDFVALVHTAVSQLPPPPLAITELPRSMAGHYVSVDPKTAHVTYALYIYPKKNLWNRAPLEAFVKEVENRIATVPALPGREKLRVTGIASNIYHSTAAIEHAFYLATAYALALIFILVLIDLRRIGQTLLAISVLALGLPMLVALMGYFGISWNFANFFGLPILIGAGHEYGVFMVHRYREVLHNPRRVWRFWDVSDRALLLCAFVTSSSFGFLIMGEHRGIRSLGLVMALGSACIYLATIMVVRPLLIWRLERKGVYTNSK